MALRAGFLHCGSSWQSVSILVVVEYGLEAVFSLNNLKAMKLAVILLGPFFTSTSKIHPETQVLLTFVRIGKWFIIRGFTHVFDGRQKNCHPEMSLGANVSIRAR